MVTAGLIVRLEAKAGKEEDVATFLRDALPLVEDEPQTVAWFAVNVGASSFAIVDVFPDEDGRQAHLDGAVAAALIRRRTSCLLSLRRSSTSMCSQRSCRSARTEQ